MIQVVESPTWRLCASCNDDERRAVVDLRIGPGSYYASTPLCAECAREVSERLYTASAKEAAPMPTSDDLRRQAAARITRDAARLYMMRNGWSVHVFTDPQDGDPLILMRDGKTVDVPGACFGDFIFNQLEHCEDRPWWLNSADILGEDPAELLGPAV